MKNRIITYLAKVIGICSISFAFFRANITYMFIRHQPRFSNKFK